MDLRSISYFVKIANVGSITGAAEQLGVAQSALSRHVRSVEDELGMPLLVRGPRGVRLTGAGLQFLERCQRVIREITLAKEELRISSLKSICGIRRSDLSYRGLAAGKPIDCWRWKAIFFWR
jgi:DNA-binding transcriptional LysR family regulator